MLYNIAVVHLHVYIMKRVLINHWLLIFVLIMLFFSAILKDNKDDDDLILVSKAFQNETPILEIENFFLCVLAK